MSKAICYGMIGCGMMGQEHLRNIALIDGARVGAIFEPDAGMRAQAARLAPEARFVDSVEALLAAQDVEALVITSPNHMHLPQLEQIARTQPRPVLVEKPLFTDAADLDRVRGLALGAPLWVAMDGPDDRRYPDADHPRTSVSVPAQGWRLEPLQRADRRNAGREMLSFLRPDAPYPA